MCSQDHTVRQVRLRAAVEKRRSLVLSTVICNGLWIGRSKKITEMHTHTHTSQFSRSHDKNRISIRRHRLCNLTCVYTLGIYVPIPRQMACEVLRARTYFSHACLGEAMEHRRKRCFPRKKKADTSGIRNQESECNHHITHETQRSAACSGPQRAYVCLPSTLVKGGGIAMSFSTLSCSAHTT